jgi:hypothetical protein
LLEEFLTSGPLHITDCIDLAWNVSWE